MKKCICQKPPSETILLDFFHKPSSCITMPSKAILPQCDKGHNTKIANPNTCYPRLEGSQIQSFSPYPPFFPLSRYFLYKVTDRPHTIRPISRRWWECLGCLGSVVDRDDSGTPLTLLLPSSRRWYDGKGLLFPGTIGAIRAIGVTVSALLRTIL